MFAAPVYLSGVPPGRQSSLLATAAFFLGSHGAAAKFVMVRHSSLAVATPGEAERWEAVNENPLAARTVWAGFKVQQHDEP